MSAIAKVIGGLGCIALAFWGYEHHIESCVWLVVLGVLLLCDID